MLKRILHTAQTVLTEPIEAEGTKLELKTVKAPFKGLHVYGRSTQETTDGVNVYAGGSVTRTWENAEDGSINVTIGNIQLPFECGDIFQEGGFLLFDCDIDVPIKVYLRPGGFDFNNWGKVTRFYIKSGENRVAIPAYSFLDGQEKVGFLIRKDNATESTGTPYTFTLSNIMVKAGQEEHEYEPYTGGMPSPNPDYPQEIQSLGSGGSIGGKVLSGNVFDSSYKNAYDVIWASGCEIEENNGVFTLICTKTDMFVWNVLNYGVNYKDDNAVCKLMDIPSGVSKISVKLSNKGFNKNYITFYDENEISTNTIFHASNVFTQTVPNGAKHYTIRFGKGDAVVGETYETTVMVNYGDPMDYIPYTEQSFTIQTPNGLPGIPVSYSGNYTDSEGQQWLCDEVDFSRGKYVQRTVKEVFDETASVPLAHTKENGEHWFNLLTKYKNLEGGKAICDRLPYDGYMRGNSFRIVGAEPSTLRISVEASELPENPTADDVKNWLKEHPLTFISPLYEPIETPLSEEELAAYKAMHSNYPATIITNSEDAYMKVNCLKILGA